MKYGEYLLSQRHPGWEEQYLNYDALKNLIKSLEVLNDQNEDEDNKGENLLAAFCLHNKSLI